MRSCCAIIAWCWCHHHVSHTPALPILPQKLRKRVKSAMKGKDAVRMLRCLAGMPLGPCLVTLTADARKSFAFQLGQALGLLLGVELYTKGEVQPLRRAVVASARVTGCLCYMCPLFACDVGGRVVSMWLVVDCLALPGAHGYDSTSKGRRSAITEATGCGTCHLCGVHRGACSSYVCAGLDSRICASWTQCCRRQLMASGP